MSLLRSVVTMMAGGALALGCGADMAQCDCPATPPRGCVYTGRQGCACAAMVCSDIGPVVDLGNEVTDVGADVATVDGAMTDAGTDAGHDAGRDVGTDVGFDAGRDVGTDAGHDAGRDVGTDVGFDAGFDAGFDVGRDVGFDAGFDVGRDVGFDVGRDVALDLPVEDALRICPIGPTDRACGMDSECVVGIYTQNCVGESRAVAYNGRAMGEFSLVEACWMQVVREMVRCSARPSRGTEIEQTGMFVTDATSLRATCMAGQCRIVRP